MIQKLPNVRFFNYLFLVAAAVCVILLLYFNSETSYYALLPKNIFKSLVDQTSELDFEEKRLKGFLINTPGCKMAKMDPLDKSVKNFISVPKAITCNNGTPSLFQSDDFTIALNISALQYYNISSPEELICCYISFWRVPPKKGEMDNKIVFSDECVTVTHTNQTITSEFIQLLCGYGNETIYEDFFSFVREKNVFSQEKQKKKSLNVLVVGLDAVSRLNFHRQMPQTSGYLQSIGTIELMGYNKVGDNTFPNLIPVLTGMFEGELKNSCWPHSHDRFDDCPFVWKLYKERGFITAFGEDATWMGMFNYQRYGFNDQPTDYAYGYFNRIAESRIGNSHNMNVFECVGARQVYQDLLNYVGKFVRAMDRDRLPYFGFFWSSSLSHDYLNKPRLGDKFYKEFFEGLKNGGHLDDTALFFVSDHGIRWGDIRQTFQGRMEERLPFVMVTLPSWFKEQYPEAFRNLRINVRRLTTPFDLHETLRDLVDLENSISGFRRYSKGSRGYSLFSKIPDTRTCADASVASHWCTCQQSREIDPANATVLQVAAFAVGHINSQLVGYADCAALTLKSVEDARLMVHVDQDLSDDFVDYMVVLTTAPGDAIFEVTVRRETTGEHEVIGTVSRLNLYGSQSRCIADFHLKLYCYCK